MEIEEWIAAAESSAEYRRETFRQSMAIRYRRESWRRTVIEKLKTRRLNNLRRNVGMSHELYHKHGFER